MKNGRLEYIEKLIKKLGIENTYVDMLALGEMLNRPFEVIVEGDQNRVGDAARLREDDDYNYPEEISVLEVLVAFAIRLDNDYLDNGPDEIFTEMLRNLGIKLHAENDLDLVDRILTRFVERDYKANGYGGLFPLSHNTSPEQWKVDLWGQAMAYIQENKERLIN